MNASKKLIFRILLTLSSLLILLSGLLVFVIYQNGITTSNTSLEKTKKALIELKGTERIPETAFWIENSESGNWFNVDWMHNHKNKVSISIYDKFGALLIKSVFFKVCPTNALKFIEDLKTEIDFYDGENIQLKDKCYLLKRKPHLATHSLGYFTTVYHQN